MAAKDNALIGIKDFKMGDPGDGIAGVALVSYPDIKEASATFTLPIPEITRFYSEVNRSAPFTAINVGNTSGIMFKFQLLGLDIDDWPKFLGGSTTLRVYSPPATIGNIYQTVEITTTETNAAGNFMKLVFPYALVTAGIDGSMTYNDLTPIDVNIEALIPISASGVESLPYTWEEV